MRPVVSDEEEKEAQHQPQPHDELKRQMDRLEEVAMAHDLKGREIALAQACRVWSIETNTTTDEIIPLATKFLGFLLPYQADEDDLNTNNEPEGVA